MTLVLTPAAVCQCFTLVSLCTSIADPSWIQISNGSDPDGKQLIYGVTFTIHAYQNLTDTGPLGGLNGVGMWLLYALAALCYSAVLFSSVSFLLDFLGMGLTNSRLVTSLHVSTAVHCVAVLGVCVACLCVIKHNLQRMRYGSLFDRTVNGLSGRQSNELQLSVGESLYIEGLGMLFSIMAAALAFSGHSEPVRNCEDASVHGEVSDTEPLIGADETQEQENVLPDEGRSPDLCD